MHSLRTLVELCESFEELSKQSVDFFPQQLQLVEYIEKRDRVAAKHNSIKLLPASMQSKYSLSIWKCEGGSVMIATKMKLKKNSEHQLASAFSLTNRT